jgi:hypothetical protein
MRLGDLEPKGVTIPVTIPTYIPPQPLEMLDPVTKEKKTFTIDNISKLIALLSQGFTLFSQIRGGTGSQVINVQTDFSRKDPDGGSGGGSGGGANTAGVSVNSLIGYGVAAAIMISLYMSLKDK